MSSPRSATLKCREYRFIGNKALQTFLTHAEFVSHAPFCALVALSNFTRLADPLRCGEARLAECGVTFPVTLFV